MKINLVSSYALFTAQLLCFMCIELFEIITLSLLKRTVSVTSSALHAKMAMPDSQQSFAWLSMNNILMFIVLKTDYFQLWILCWSDLYIFIEGKHYQNKTLLNLEKRKYLPHNWSDKVLKGIVVNRALSRLHAGSLETMHTVPFNPLKSFDL